MAEIVYRQARPEDLPVAAQMYTRLDQAYRSQMTFFFPPLEPENYEVGQAWLDSFQRTLGRFSVLFVAEKDGELLGFVLGRVKRTPLYLGGVMVGEISEVWVEPPA
ncbi:MAG TPA: GNAT family N-acetyltransferase, partial [Anaerolineales bacterium]|nr:GNAT family N-acetyltransferase [Anaerolineales bacterium]